MKKKILYLKDDGFVPNSKYPAIVHQNGFTFTKRDPDEARAELEAFAKTCGWKVDWLYPVYKKLHYHSTTHEALVVWSGTATIQLGGPRLGHSVKVYRSAIIVLPAGVGHQALERSADFLVFGLYPIGAPPWDMLYGRKKDREIALPNLSRLEAPPPFEEKK